MSSISYVSSAKIKLCETVDVKSNLGQHIQKAAAMQAQFQMLEKELKAFRQLVTEYLVREDLDQVKCGDFTVSKTTRANYTYSNKLELEMERIKADQKWEVSKGMASNNPTISCSLRTITKK